MTAAATGFVHEAGFYSGEDGLLPLIVPFVQSALAADESVVIALGGTHAEMARAVLPQSPRITYLSANYTRPAGTIAALLGVLRANAEVSPGRVRIVGELAGESMSSGAWGPWARYEAAVNHLYAPFRATAMCAYDTNALPPVVLADIEATHPCVARVDGVRFNSLYQDPDAFLQKLSVPPDPLEATRVSVESVDPDLSSARQAVRVAAAGCAIDADDVEDLVAGVSEVVANAQLYGRAPVLLRVWAAADRMIAVVSDEGSGPLFAYAGLVPVDAASGGRGLWITHQMCGQVDHVTGATGFAVRLATSPPRG